MPPASAQRGIAYIGLLLLVAMIGVIAGSAADVWVHTRQRAREAELLWVGNEFREAFVSYYINTPGPNKTYPARLEDLLLDPRFPGVRRHLRRLYADPLSGKTDWDLIMAPQGGIAGVKSKSKQVPIKQANFRPRDEHFEGKSSLSEWEFSAIPPAAPAAPAAPAK